MRNAVLYEPEIPQNTGNIMRTCSAFGWVLHLIEPLGFYLDEAHLKRAGMDYIGKMEYHVWPDWQTFYESHPGEYYFTTRYGTKTPDSFSYSAEKDLYLVFGKESTGIDKEILRNHLDRCMRIPMEPDARCLNVSNTAAICMYEVERQLGYPGLSREEVQKGSDFLQRSCVL